MIDLIALFSVLAFALLVGIFVGIVAIHVCIGPMVEDIHAVICKKEDKK
jgi:hypothetical protein